MELVNRWLAHTSVTAPEDLVAYSVNKVNRLQFRFYMYICIVLNFNFRVSPVTQYNIPVQCINPAVQ